MKIDEPKTPYVTDEEFRRLCEEDPDYEPDEQETDGQKLGEMIQIKATNQEEGEILRSDQAENEGDLDENDCIGVDNQTI